MNGAAGRRAVRLTAEARNMLRRADLSSIASAQRLLLEAEALVRQPATAITPQLHQQIQSLGRFMTHALSLCEQAQFARSTESPGRSGWWA
jgi:hypothetical protein